MNNSYAKRIVSILLTIATIATIICFGTVASSAASYVCTNERLQYYIDKYEGAYWNSSYHGSYKCKGFADMMFNEIYGTGPIGPYNSGYHYYLPDHNGAVEVARTSKASYQDVYDMMHLAKSGNYVQWSRGYSQHSAIFISCDEKGFYLFDCNYIASNTCGTHYVTYEKIASTNYGISIYASTTEPLPVTWKSSEKTTVKSTTKKVAEATTKPVETTTAISETTTTAVEQSTKPVEAFNYDNNDITLGFFETYNLGLGSSIDLITSSDESVATVSDSGIVSSFSAGNATITAVLTDGSTVNFDVTVSYLSYSTIIKALFGKNVLHESIVSGIC